MANYFSKMSLAKLGSILIFSAIIIGCQTKKEFTIRVLNQDTNTDSLFIREIATGKVLAKIPLKSKAAEFNFPLETSTIGLVSYKNAEQNYMVILKPNGRTNLRIDSTSFKSHDNLADSLVNFLLSNMNEAFSGKNSTIIFGQDNPEKVTQLFDSIKVARQSLLESYKNRLSKEEFEILQYQSAGRIHSFLLFYGRMVKKYEPTNSFFAFIRHYCG